MRFQTFTTAVSNVCGRDCKRYPEHRLFSEIVSPILDERKGGSIRVTIVPRKILLSGQEPR